jgi:hypothetical protein
MKVKIPFRVFFILSAYSERRGKCLSVYGEYGEFRVVCRTQSVSKESMRTWTERQETQNWG